MVIHGMKSSLQLLMVLPRDWAGIPWLINNVDSETECFLSNMEDDTKLGD